MVAAELNLDNVVDLYIRVSTAEQAEEGYSVGEQEERLRSYCSAYGYAIHAVHVDAGFSGASLDRPAIQKVIYDVKHNLCKKVIVWKLDRLSRSQKDTLILLEDVFLANGCNFISLMESFDTSTPFGRCIVGILAAFAQMERENIKMRTMMGIQAGLKAGYFYAPTAPIGYVFQMNPDNKKELVVDMRWSRMIKELYGRIDTGEALGSIAHDFKTKYGFWKGTRNDTSSELSRIARRRVYMGKVERGGKVYDGRHTAIVDEELWERVNARLQENKKAYKRMFTTSDGLLSGLLFCGDCGGRLSIRGWGYKTSKVNKYVCYSVSKCNKRMIKDPNCTNRKNLFSVSDLDQLVLAEIKKLALDRSAFDSLAPESNTGTDDMDLYRERLDSIDRQMERILNLYQAGVMELDEISERMSELKEQRAEVAEALEELQGEDERALSKSEAWNMVCSLSDIIEHGTPDELFALVHTLIEKVVVLNGEITIHWAFC